MIIQCTKTLRVRDADANNYTIEYLSGHAKDGTENWKAYAFHQTTKALSRAVVRAVGEQAAEIARAKASDAFEASDAYKALSGLPKK